jgi:hypothetical protein
VAIGGLDAHAPGIRVRGGVRSIMPHARWFGLLRTHLVLQEPFTGDGEADCAAALGAVREGSCALARVDLGDPSGFRLSANGPDGRTWPMGAEAGARDLRLVADVPGDADLRLLRDGRLAARTFGCRIAAEVHVPGVYRVEPWRSAHGTDQPWIISNPVFVR